MKCDNMEKNKNPLSLWDKMSHLHGTQNADIDCRSLGLAKIKVQ
jgi:hypothetical protein